VKIEMCIDKLGDRFLRARTPCIPTGEEASEHMLRAVVPVKPGKCSSSPTTTPQPTSITEESPPQTTVIVEQPEEKLRAKRSQKNTTKAGIGNQTILSVDIDEDAVRDETLRRTGFTGVGDDVEYDEGDKVPITGVFGDLGTKNEIRLDEKIYDVRNLYKDTGWVQQVARSDGFMWVTLTVIALNAIYLGIDTDRNPEEYILDAHWAFIMCENTFCVYFSAEIAIRFCAFKRKISCLQDGWFKFDAILVALMVFETWLLPSMVELLDVETANLPTGPFRLLRLLRLSRLARLVRSLPDVVTLVKGMWVASRAVCCSLLMVVLLIYTFSIVVYMFLEKEPLEEAMRNKFESLGFCMWTLLLDGTFMDSTGTVLTLLLRRQTLNSSVALIFFMLFILLSAMTVMNMLIGVLCEVVSEVAQSERDEAAVCLMKKTILVELLSFDKDGNRMISEEELTQVMENDETLTVLRSLEIDPSCLRELYRMMFYKKGKQVSIERVMELLLMYRGNLPITVRHMADIQAYTRWLLTYEMAVNQAKTGMYIRELGDRLVQARTPCILAREAACRDI